MSRRNARRLALLLCLPVCLAMMPVTAGAQDADEDEPTTLQKPLVIFNVASVDRLTKNVAYMFELIDRPEMMEAVNGLLSNVGNLEGMTRDKPFGAMLFLPTGFPPTPEVVGFVPVTDIEALLKTVELGPVVTKPVSGQPGRFEIIGPSQTLQVLMQGDYAFIGRDADLLNRDFPAPDRFTQRLTSRFDISVSANLDTIPAGMRQLFMNVVQASASAEMQQRDDEPYGQYKIRRANAESTLRDLTQFLTEGERFTIGAKASPEDKNAALEILMDAQEDSRLLERWRAVGGRRSYFADLVDEESPFTMSVSAVLTREDKEVMDDMMIGLESELRRIVNDGDAEAPLPDALMAALESISNTVDEGHMNLFAQFEGEPKKFTVVGGLKTASGDGISRGLFDALTRLQENRDVGGIELNAANHQGVQFHRIQSREDLRRDEEAFWGDKPGVYIGASSRVLWFAVGGDDVMDTLKGKMDRLVEPTDVPRSREPSPPFRLVFNLRKWLGLGQDDEDEDEDDGPGIAQQAFADGGDRIQVDMKTTDSGLQLRAQVDEGFVRLLGLALARNFDRRQERRAERERQRQEEADGRDSRQ